MSSILAKLFNLNCPYVSDPSEPYVCITKGGLNINPWLILTADIFLVILVIVGVIVLKHYIKRWTEKWMKNK